MAGNAHLDLGEGHKALARFVPGEGVTTLTRFVKGELGLARGSIVAASELSPRFWSASSQSSRPSVAGRRRRREGAGRDGGVGLPLEGLEVEVVIERSSTIPIELLLFGQYQIFLHFVPFPLSLSNMIEFREREKVGCEGVEMVGAEC